MIHFTSPVRSVIAFGVTVFITMTACLSVQAQTPSYVVDNATSHNYANLSGLPEFERYDTRNRWQQVDAEAVIAEMKRFKGVKASPAMREIWRKNLLGDFNGLQFDSQAQQTPLFAARLNLLIQLGFFDEAVRLYQQAAQQKPVPESIARLGVDAMAFSGAADGACLEAMLAAQHLPGLSWAQDAAMCTAYFGQTDRAAEIYAHVADKSDGAFRKYYKTLLKDSNIALPAQMPPLWRVLLLAKGNKIAASAADDIDPVTAASLSKSKYVPLGMQLRYASLAADNGMIGFDRLRKLYERAHKTEKNVPAILARIENGDRLSQADYYAAARFTFEGSQRASIVGKALSALKPRTNVKSHVYGWIVDKLTLQSEERLAAFAPQGYVLMLLTNRAQSADMYYKAGSLQHTTLAVMQAFEKGKPWPKKAQDEWRHAMQNRFGATADKRIDRALQVLRAYDDTGILQPTDAGKSRKESHDPVILTSSIKSGGRGLTLFTGLNRLAESKQIADHTNDELAEIMHVFGNQGLFTDRKKIGLEILAQTVL